MMSRDLQIQQLREELLVARAAHGVRPLPPVHGTNAAEDWQSPIGALLGFLFPTNGVDANAAAAATAQQPRKILHV